MEKEYEYIDNMAAIFPIDLTSITISSYIKATT